MEKDKHTDMDIPVEKIRQKGKKLGFSYIQSLSLYLFETILCWVSQSDLKDDMWLKWSELDRKRMKGAPNQIIYYRKDISYLTLQQAIDRMCKDKSNNHFQLDWDMLFFDKQMEIVLTVKIEHVIVSFKIVIRPVWEKEQFPEKRIYRSLFWENREIVYKSYPIELNLAECFYEILDRLELIKDMEPYGTICQILGSYPVDGRRTYLNMAELLKKQELTSVKKRWDTVLGYKDYTYMEKRWKKYCKTDKEQTVSWEECMGLLKEFFTPVWNSIQEDRIFVGDWMPHLGRYLN